MSGHLFERAIMSVTEKSYGTFLRTFHVNFNSIVSNNSNCLSLVGHCLWITVSDTRYRQDQDCECWMGGDLNYEEKIAAFSQEDSRRAEEAIGKSYDQQTN